MAIARAVAAAAGDRTRVFEVAPAGIVPDDDPELVATELDWIGRMVTETGLTATYIILQHTLDPDRWRREMDQARRLRRQGAEVYPLVAGRPFGLLLGSTSATRSAVAPPTMPSTRSPGRAGGRAPSPRGAERILGEKVVTDDRLLAEAQNGLAMILPRCFVLGDPPDYEPPADHRVEKVAERRGVTIEELAYDALLEANGRGMLLFPAFNYAEGDHEVLREQLLDPDAVLGLDDGGAHCGAICDASIPTYMLTHWVRDRTRGPRLDLADVVRRLTSQPADLYGLADRAGWLPVSGPIST